MMGRTKRLRRKKSRVVEPGVLSAISLYDYMKRLGWKNHSGLICSYFPTTGRGLCSKHEIKAGEVLIKLPLDSMITLVTLESDCVFRNVISENGFPASSLSFQSLLALYVLYQMHECNTEFNIRLYLNSIPKSFSTPYFCQLNELHYVPEIVLQHTVEQNKNIRKNYDILKQPLENKHCNYCGKSYLEDIFPLNSFKWAYFVVNTRSVYVNMQELKSAINVDKYQLEHILCDQPDMALAPFLDLFNHSDRANIKPTLIKDSSEISFQIYTNVPYKPFEEIFISYGNLNNLRLLVDYGFSIKDNTNDYFSFTISDVEAFIRNDPSYRNQVFHSNKFKFIRDHNLSDQMFIHLHDGLSHNLKVTLYILFREQSHFFNILNQTAFGFNIHHESLIEKEAKSLILYKIREYESLVNGFQTLSQVSASGQAAIHYLENSILFLSTYLDINLKR